MGISREILFRGKTILDNEWVIGAGVYKSEGHTWIITDDITKTENRGTGSDAINPETAGQYTGLTDKNGTKIFGGDVCQIKGVPRYDETPFVIEWNNEFGGWYWKDVDGSDTTDALWQIVTEKAEVIGNIHDNPELLKGETDNA